MATRLKLRICTWNLGNAPPPSDMRSWLLGAPSTEPFALIAIGVQECHYLPDRLHTVDDVSVLPDDLSPTTSFSVTDALRQPELEARSRKPSPKHILSKAVKSVRRSISRSPPPIALPDAQRTPSPASAHSPRALAPDSLRRDVQSQPARTPVRSMPGRPAMLLSPWNLNSTKSARSDNLFSAKSSRSEQNPFSDFSTWQISDVDDSLLRHRSGMGMTGVRKPPPRLPCLDGVVDPLALDSLDTLSLSEPASEDTVLLDDHSSPPRLKICSDSSGSSGSSDSSDELPVHGDADASSDDLEWADNFSHHLPKPSPKLAEGSADACASANLDGVSNDQRKFAKAVADAMPTEYALIAKVQMMEMQLMVYVHCILQPRVESHAVMSEATGVANLVGNKGAVGMKVFIDGTSFCFVNSHLAAHAGDKYLRQRHADVVTIMAKLERIGKVGMPMFHRYDHVFWMGDLNYRLNLERLVPAAISWSLRQRWEYVCKLILDGRVGDVASMDELRQEMEAGHIFSGFAEGALTFPPTFKVVRGRGDGTFYQSARVPSYCDRILWRSAPMHCAHVKLREYDCVIGLDTSDHKPVFAVFDVVIPAKIFWMPLPAARHSFKCTLRFCNVEVVGGFLMGCGNGQTDEEDDFSSTSGWSSGWSSAWGSPSVGASSLRSVWGSSSSSGEEGPHGRRIVSGSVFGHDLFVGRKGYRFGLQFREGDMSTRDGVRLPCIAVRAVQDLRDLLYKYVVIVFHPKNGCRVGHSCVLPLAGLVSEVGVKFSHVELPLTRFGAPCGLAKLDVGVRVSVDRWRDIDDSFLPKLRSRRKRRS